MTQKEFDWLKKIEAGVDKAWDDLTDWEKRFIEDILERFKQWGKKTFVSKKQWSVISKISEKII